MSTGLCSGTRLLSAAPAAEVGALGVGEESRTAVEPAAEPVAEPRSWGLPIAVGVGVVLVGGLAGGAAWLRRRS